MCGLGRRRGRGCAGVNSHTHTHTGYTAHRRVNGFPRSRVNSRAHGLIPAHLPRRAPAPANQRGGRERCHGHIRQKAAAAAVPLRRVRARGGGACGERGGASPPSYVCFPHPTRQHMDVGRGVLGGSSRPKNTPRFPAPALGGTVPPAIKAGCNKTL